MRKIGFATATALIGVVNFFAFLCGALKIGGDAVNGTAFAGHYFVASHGKLTEVSKGVYTYSLYHVYSLILTAPLTMLAMLYLAMKLMDNMMPKGKRDSRTGG